MRPLRALFVDEGIGGHLTVHAALERALAARDDVDAEFLHVPDPGTIGRVLRRPLPVLGPLDLDLQPLRAQLVRSAWTRRALARRLARGDLDVLHVYTQNTALLSVDQLRSVPTVVTTDSTTALNAYRLPYRAPTRYTPWGVRRSRPFEQGVLRAARHVVANSTFVQRSLLDDYGLAPDHVSVLPFGVWLPPPPAPRPERRPTIVFTGHDLERKGGRRLLRLHQEHLRDRCDLVLVTTDAVPVLPGVRVVSDLRSGDDRLWDVLAAADVMCFPSTIDQAPNAVLEGAAAGLPVVAHPVGAVPDMVLDGETGLLVPQDDDDDALRRALERLLDDAALRGRMGRAARAHTEARYDMRVSADRLIEVLRSAVDTPAAGPRVTVDVQVVRDEAALARLLPEWDALADARASGFASRPSYALAWWRALGTGELAVVTGRREGRLVALAPLHLRSLLGQPVLRWLGHGLGTVGELLVEDAAAADAVWTALAAQEVPLQLVHVRLDDPATLVLRRSTAWDVVLTVDDRCPGSALPPGTTSADLRGKASLKRLRRYRSVLERDGRPFDADVVEDVDALRRRWPDIQRVAADADRDRGRTDLCGAPYDAFSLPFLEAEARAGRLLVVGGTVGGVWSAHEIGLRHGRRVDLWLSRFDPSLARFGLGHLVAERMVDDHEALGVDALDFGIGENAYKAAWCTTGYDVATLVAVPRGRRTVRARLALAAALGDAVRRRRAS